MNNIILFGYIDDFGKSQGPYSPEVLSHWYNEGLLPDKRRIFIENYGPRKTRYTLGYLVRQANGGNPFYYAEMHNHKVQMKVTSENDLCEVTFNFTNSCYDNQNDSTADFTQLSCIAEYPTHELTRLELNRSINLNVFNNKNRLDQTQPSVLDISHDGFENYVSEKMKRRLETGPLLSENFIVDHIAFTPFESNWPTWMIGITNPKSVSRQFKILQKLSEEVELCLLTHVLQKVGISKASCSMCSTKDFISEGHKFLHLISNEHFSKILSGDKDVSRFSTCDISVAMQILLAAKELNISSIQRERILSTKVPRKLPIEISDGFTSMKAFVCTFGYWPMMGADSPFDNCHLVDACHMFRCLESLWTDAERATNKYFLIEELNRLLNNAKICSMRCEVCPQNVVFDNADYVLEHLFDDKHRNSVIKSGFAMCEATLWYSLLSCNYEE